MDGEQYCGEGWARGAQPMRKPFDAAAAKRRGRAPPNKLDEPQDLGTSMLGHLLAIATTFCGHVMCLDNVQGITHYVKEIGEPRYAIANTVWFGYGLSYGPAATGTRFKVRVVYIMFLDVDTNTLVTVDPPLEETRDLMGEDWGSWQFASTATAGLELDVEGEPQSWRGVPLTRELRCPSCHHPIGVGEEALVCARCALQSSVVVVVVVVVVLVVIVV